MVKDINPESGSSNPVYLTNMNGTLFFQASDGTNGNELWKSDGTEVGTTMVKDIAVPNGHALNSSSPMFLTNVNGTLFFTAENGTEGRELWKSSGTELGTTMVKDINPGSGGSSPADLTAINSTLFFSANDGTNGYELWKSDGTEGGTVMVKDINPGSGGSSLFFLINIGGTLFFCANDGTHGYEPWMSDGTAAGTVMIKDVYAGANSGFGD
jgi:ELWxxDGT repeat protein